MVVPTAAAASNPTFTEVIQASRLDSADSLGMSVDEEVAVFESPR